MGMLFPEAQIAHGLENGEFYPVFQPLVETRTGGLVGFETLARWRHPLHGLLMPDRFISSVEECGLINALTCEILAAAFELPELADTALTLSVNLSPPQLLDPGLPSRLEEAASRGGFALDRLVLEITESALLEDLARAQTAAHALKAMHCKLSLDDFGTGYSSLRHLHALPFDEIKIDRSFVTSMTEQRESRKIVASVIGMGQSLRLTTVAEGVETQEQANMLLWLGCDRAQGWLYGRPASAAAVADTVASLRGIRHVSPIPNDDLTMSLEPLPAQRFALLQAVYDGAPVGLCFLDREMRYLSLNRRLAEMNGVPAASHVGRPVTEVIPDVARLVQPLIQRALRGEAISGVEIQKPPIEGHPGRTLLLSYQPARDEAGEVLGVSVAIMDITERKRAAAALRESEEHYRHMMQLGPHVPWVLNTRGEVTEASSRWEDFTGQPIAEALGNGWLKMLHPDDAVRTVAAIQTSLATGQPIDIEYRVRRSGGRWHWMRSRGSPRFGPSGKIVCIYGVVEEVHCHRQTSDELQRTQAALRTAIDSVRSGMVVIDARSCAVVMLNGRARQIFGNAVMPGATLSEYEQLPFWHIDGHRLLPDEFPLVRSILRSETVEDFPVELRRDDGIRLRLLISTKPIYAEDGQLIGGLSVLREIDASDVASDRLGPLQSARSLNLPAPI